MAVDAQDSKSYPERSAIIKDHALKEFDKIENSESSWAGANVELDYSSKPVFSDDEDAPATGDKW